MKPAALPLVLAGLAALLACPSVPTARYYQLRGPAGAAEAAARRGGGPSIGVRELRVDPPYDEERIVYRVGRDAPEVGFYAYHRWAAPLSRMLPALIAGVLAEAPGLGRVEPARPGGRYDAYLGGRVLAIEEIDVDGAPSVHVSLLLRLEDGEGTELWAKPVALSSTVQSGEVAGVVAGIERLLLDGLRATGDEIARALR